MLSRTFHAFWPTLQARFSEVIDIGVPEHATESQRPAVRPEREILNEILELVRGLALKKNAD